MPSIIRIAWNELRSLFVSPIAWVLLVVFILHSSTLFIERLDRYAAFEFTTGNEGRALSQSIFTHPRGGVLTLLLPYLLLYVPLLTMSVFSRDIQSGAMKLLLSSPLRLTSVVLGKYLSVALYFALFGVVLICFLIGTGIIVENVDYAHILTAIFGIYLLICTYAAVGVFVSSLTGNQVVAAIVTLAALGLLEMLWRVGQDWPVIGEVAYWLSMSGRVEYMIRGLLTTKDVLYYFLIIALFLGLTYLRFDAGRRTEPRVLLGVRIAILAVGTFGLGVASSTPGWVGYWDTTRRVQNTLTQVSQDLVDRARGPITVTAYINVLDVNARSYLASERRSLVRFLFDRYFRFNPELSVRYVFYYGPPASERILEANPTKSLEGLAREWARDNEVPFWQIRSYVDLDTPVDLAEENYRPLYVFEWQDQVSVLRTFDDDIHHPTEREVSHTLFRMTDDPVVVAYFVGSGARSALERGLGNHRVAIADPNIRRALINSGFDILEFGAEDPMPRGIDLLVVAGPQQPLPGPTLQTIQGYISGGGDMIILAEPGSEEALRLLLSPFGVEQISGEIRQKSATDLGIDIQDTTVFADATQKAVSLGLARQPNPFSFLGSVTLETPSAFRFVDGSPNSPFTVSPIFTPDGATRLDGETLPDEAFFGFIAQRSIENGDEQRIYVVSDADVFASSMIAEPSLLSPQNPQVFERAIGWLTSGRLPLDMSWPNDTVDSRLLLTVRAVDHVRLLLFVILPVLLGMFGYSVLSRRKRA